MFHTLDPLLPSCLIVSELFLQYLFTCDKLYTFSIPVLLQKSYERQISGHVGKGNMFHHIYISSECITKYSFFQ